MQKLVFTNGGGQTIDLTSGNFGITNWEGLSGVGLNIQTQQVPFQDGGVFLDALMEQREISVTVAIQDNNDLSARYERKRQLISALNPKLGEGVLVYTNDYLSRQIKAVPQLPIFENKNSNDAGTLKANVVFSCPSPYWEDLGETALDIATDEVVTINNKGDVPAQVKIDLYVDNVSNPEIKNITTGKKIKYLGEINNTVQISTEIGNKYIKEFKYDDVDFWQTLTSFLFETITYNPDIETYFAYGGAGNVGILLKSKDLENWQNCYSSSYFIVSSMYSEILHKSVFLNSNGDFITTEDGKTFNEVNIGDGSAISPFAICETSNNIICGCGEYNKLYISSDGINWTAKTITGLSGLISAFVYAPDLNMIIGVGFNDNGLSIVKSTDDGNTWTFQVNTSLNSSWAVAYSKDLQLFIIVDKGTGNQLTSTDGTSWTFRNTTQLGRIIKWIEDKSIFVAMYDTDIKYSNDGINWVNVPNNLQASIHYFIFVEEKYIACGVGIIAKSSDMTRWLELIQTYDFREYYSSIYCDYLQKFIITDGENILISSEGEEWEIIVTTMQGIEKLYCNEKKLQIIAVGSNGKIYTSYTGREWEEHTTGISVQLKDITYNETIEKYIVVGNTGTILTSQNGINWEQQTSGVSVNLNGVYSNESAIIVVGNSGTILKSNDGINWTSVTSGTNINLNKISYNGMLGLFGTFVIVANNGKILKSIDSLYSQWQIIDTGKSQNIVSLFFNEYEQVFYAGYGTTSIGGGGVLFSKDCDNWAELEKLSSETIGLSFAVSSKNKRKIIGQIWFVSYSDVPAEENIIDKMSNDSDLGLNLEVGENKIMIDKTSGEYSITLKYRQKYIGV